MLSSITLSPSRFLSLSSVSITLIIFINTLLINWEFYAKYFDPVGSDPFSSSQICLYYSILLSYCSLFCRNLATYWLQFVLSTTSWSRATHWNLFDLPYQERHSYRKVTMPPPEPLQKLSRMSQLGLSTSKFIQEYWLV